MAGAALVRLAPFLERVKRADFVALVVDLAVGLANEFAEFVIEPLVAEITFLLRHPFVQAEMWFDDEFCHCLLSLFSRLWGERCGGCGRARRRRAPGSF